MLLSRVADRIYWAARYVERAEDTARIVRAHGETAADLPMEQPRSWKPLVTVAGSDAQYDARFGDEVSEGAVVTFLLSDRENPGSVVSCVAAARENLRTTRETIPRDGWQTLNDLSLYVSVESDRGIDRRVRERFLGRVIADSRRLDGVLAASMTHDEAYAMWRLGRALERADMTTRVLGVRAAAVLSAAPGSDEELRFRYDDLQWMGVLRSLTALQMYQRAVRGPIDGPNVVRFLLEHDRFPRAVRALLARDAPGARRAARPVRDHRRGRHRRRDAARLHRRGHRRRRPRPCDGRPPAGARPARPAHHRSLPSAGLTDPISVMPAPSELLDHLLRDRAALIRRQSEADRVLAASGAGHLVHEMNVRPDEAGGRPWRIDPVPLILDGAVFDRLADHVAARVRVFESLLSDLYGPRMLVRDGVVPGEALSSSRRYRVGTVGSPAPARWLTTYAADVIELADGSWRVVQDLTDAPTGVGYALLDRSAMLRVADELLGAEELGDVASLSAFPAELRHALITNTTVSSPRIVLFTGGVDHAGYVEHSSLARLLGFTLVERPDLVVRQNRLWLRSLGGLDPIDVVYRRVEDDDTDPIEISAAGGAGVPGLLVAVADGGVVLANAHGSGVLEDPSLAPYWTDAAEAVGSALELAPLDAADRSTGFATVPVFRRGELTDAAVVVRLHAVAGPDGVVVMPGGNGRVLAPGDDPRDPTAHLAKDVWVLGALRPSVAIAAPSLPQVDLSSSVPTRAADALFWAGRAAERAAAIAIAVRTIAGRRRQDPTLVTYEGGRWATRMAAALRGVREAAADEDEGDHRGPIGALDAELVAATKRLVDRLRVFVAEAATVGEFLPSNTARVLNQIVRLTELFGDGAAPIDVIDDVLASLASFSGMWMESTVRGPAWRFGDIGTRLERALVLLALVRACVDVETEDRDVVGVAALEVLLAASESLIAYRRTFRSDVELIPTLTLLLHDRDNPRAYVSCIDRIAENVADIGWADGSARVAALDKLVAALASDGVGPAEAVARLGAVEDAIDEFAAALVERWFATPVRPVLVHGERLMTRTQRPCARSASEVPCRGLRAPASRAGAVHYRVSHTTTYEYSRPMTDGYTVAYVLPRPTPHQLVERALVDVKPDVDDSDEHTDAFGNRVLQFGVHHQHDMLSVHATSEVVVEPMSLDGDGPAWESVAAAVRECRGGEALQVRPFAGGLPLVEAVSDIDELRRLVASAFAPGRPVIDAARAFCHRIYESFDYDRAFTDVSTPLSTVLAARRGVCQDFAHLAVGGLRLLGLAARYVSGYIETRPPAGGARPIGADASHAWCSFWVPDNGWVDFDPTNDHLPVDRHVTVAWGRDYNDVPPVRGVVIGPPAHQTLSVAVAVTRVAAP